MALVLRTLPDNKNAYKPLIAAEYCGVMVEHEKKFQMGVSDQRPVFLKSYPMGEFPAPVLETPDGPLVESNTMARFVAKLKGDNALCGSSVYEFSLVEQWINFAAKEIDAVLARWILPGMGHYPHNAPAVNTAKMKVSLSVLNAHLATNPHYLVGQSITLADIVMACDLHLGFTRIMTKSFTASFPHVERYFWSLVNEPEFKKIMGEVKQAESDSVPSKMSKMGEPSNVMVGAMSEQTTMTVSEMSEPTMMNGEGESGSGRVKRSLDLKNI